MDFRPHISWNALPMLRILAPFTVGIILASRIDLSGYPILLLLGTSLAFFLLTHLLVSRWFLLRYPSSVAGHLTILLLGSWLAQQHLPNTLPQNSLKGTMLATVTQVPESRQKTDRVILLIEGYADTTLPDAAKTKIIAYMAKDSANQSLLPGDRIWFGGELKLIAPPANPGMFDFQGYMRNKGIAYSTYIAAGHWQKAAGTNRKFLVRRYATIMNSHIQERLFTMLQHPGDRAVVAGILLGARAQIGDDVREQFTRSGIMHILSVSGMHVGILYAILLLLFRWVPAHNRRLQLYRDVIILVVIWTFAFVTGLAPAVQRASFMFSLLTLGKLLNRKAPSINLVAGSALVLLVFNPGLVFHIGFQLSYSAVAGIVLCFNPIYRLWQAPNKFMDLAWQTCALSFSAQLATSPLTWYYFGQVPLYFLPGNLLAMPLAPAIMGLGLALTVVSPVTWLAQPIAWGLQGAIWCLLHGTRLISELPGAGIRAGYMHAEGVWLLYLIMAGLLAAFLLRRKWGWWMALGSLAVLSVTTQYNSWQSRFSGEVIVWEIKGHTAITSRTGGQVALWADSTFLHNTNTLSYHLDGYLRQHRAKLSYTENIDSSGRQFIHTREKTLGIYIGKGQDIAIPVMAEPVYADAVVIRKNAYLDARLIERNFSTETIVPDASNYTSKIPLYRRLLPGKEVVQLAGAIQL